MIDDAFSDLHIVLACKIKHEYDDGPCRQRRKPGNIFVETIQNERLVRLLVTLQFVPATWAVGCQPTGVIGLMCSPLGALRPCTSHLSPLLAP